MARHRARRAPRYGRTVIDRRLRKWARQRARRVGRWVVRVGKRTAHNWRTYHVSPPVSAQRPSSPGRPGGNRIRPEVRAKYQPNQHRTQQHRTDQRRRPAAPTQGGRMTVGSRPRVVGVSARIKAATPETEAMRTAAHAVAGIEFTGAVDVYSTLHGLATAHSADSHALLVTAETLAAMNCDPRITGPLADIGADLADIGARLAHLARTYATLYAGQLEQETNGGRAMKFPTAA